MYKVIKEFPLYEVGDIINKSNPLYYHCALHEKFFEEIENLPLNTLDDTILEIGEKGYYVSGLDINNFIYHNSNQMIPDFLFKSYVNAEDYIHKQIYLKVEDGEVIGENIKLYSVCCKAEWNMDSIMSFKLFKSSNFKDSWKFFISKDNRDKYVLENKPRFSNKKVDILMTEFANWIDSNDLALISWKTWESTNPDNPIKAETTEELLEIFKKDYYE